MINELDFELGSTYTCICMPIVEGHTLTSRFLNIFLCHQVAVIRYTFIELFFSFYLPISHSMMYSSKKFVSSLIVTIQLQKSPKDSKEKLIKLERLFLSSQWKRDFCLDSCYSIKRNTNIPIFVFYKKTQLSYHKDLAYKDLSYMASYIKFQHCNFLQPYKKT